jgi:hypothetical protein
LNFLDSLKGVMRRTERNVALAGAMVGSVKAMESLFPAMEHYDRLTVKFYSGGSIWWEAFADEPVRGPWNHFLKWYHGRQSECFVMRHKKGSDMIRRVDIRSYSILTGIREKGTNEPLSDT